MIRMSAFLVVAALFASIASAQDMEEKYQAKLKKDFATKVSWTMSLEKATAKAAEENKLIFGYFTRSYAP